MAKARKPQKGKPPAFQFYPGDFMTGTITMSLTAVGAYVRLLCHQWESGGVPADDPVALAQAMVCQRSKAAAIWSLISHKFSRSKKDGLWRNSRLEFERKKQIAFSKLQSAKGKRGGRPKSRGFSPAFIRLKPDESSSSSIFRSVQEPPLPPSASGAEGSRVTRAERTWAQTVRREFGGCPHPTQGDEACRDEYACIGKLVGAKRAAEQRGLKAGVS